MRQFQVPQFITVEDTVIGPFTIKQFLYLGAGALLILAARNLLLAYFFWPIATLIGAFAASLAFLKMDERPFPVVLKNAFFYFWRPRLYVWQKEAPQAAAEKGAVPKTTVRAFPRPSESKLSDLAWSLDIKERRE